MPSDPWAEEPSELLQLQRLLELGEEAGPRLRKVAREARSPVLRALAAAALEAPPPVASESLARLLDGLASPDLSTRLGCARSLALAGDATVLPVLKRRWPLEELPSVRKALLDGVAALGGAGQWPFLASCWTDRDRDVRMKLLELAARLAPHQDLVAFVLQALKDLDAEVKAKAMSLLMIAGSTHRETRLEDLELTEDLVLGPADKVALAQRLILSPDRDLLPLLRSMAGAEEPPEVVAEALRAIAVVGGEGDLELIRDSLARHQPQVVAQALLCLAALGDRREMARVSTWSTGAEPAVLHAAALVYSEAGGSPPDRSPSSLASYPPGSALDRYVRRSVDAVRAGRISELSNFRPASDAPPPFPWKLLAGASLVLAVGLYLLR